MRYADSNGEQLVIARYTLAVNRKGRDAGADFISCVGFGKNGEFAEKYLKQGIKIAVEGHIQTGSYTDKNGQKRFTTEVVIDNQEFVESKGSEGQPEEQPEEQPEGEFMDIPEGIENDLPFKG